jgi:single-stranded DNA-specific DHH superfamily exonuclease
MKELIPYKEIKKLLNESENPLFFYDDDPDGLCSYLLLRKYIGRGKGLVVKTSHFVNSSLLKFVEKYYPDKIFVLDTAEVSQDFVDKAKVPVIWIDHHPLVDIKGIKYYNPQKKYPKLYVPTSYLCYKIIGEKYKWIAMIGCIGDYFIPDFFDEFYKKHKDLLIKTKDPGKIAQETEFGKLVRILNFILKGKNILDINKIADLLLKIKNPYELLNQETKEAKFIYEKYEKINKKYEEIYNKAIKSATKEKLLVFKYPDQDISFTSYLSNALTYRFPDKFIIIAREVSSGDSQFETEFRMSLRYKKHNLPKILKKSLEGLNGYGGGHEFACGASIKKKDFNRFIENLKKIIQKQS